MKLLVKVNPASNRRLVEVCSIIMAETNKSPIRHKFDGESGSKVEIVGGNEKTLAAINQIPGVIARLREEALIN